METPTTAYGKFELDLPANVDFEEIKLLFETLQNDVEGFDDLVLKAIDTVSHKDEKNPEETTPQPKANPSSSSVSDSVSVPKMDKETTQTRFKKLDENALDEMENEVYSMTTKKNTKWGIGVFNAWCSETYGSVLDLETIDESELNEKLRKFFAEAQPKKVENREKNMNIEHAKEYHKHSMKNVRAAINRYLKDIGRDTDIVNGINFRSANTMLSAKLKSNLKAGVSRPTAHYPVIDPEEMKKIHEYLKGDGPICLRLRVWYLFAIHFVSRGMEFHKQLKISSIRILTDSTGCEYITLSHETCKQITREVHRK